MCQLATRVVTTEPSANRDARGVEPRSAPHEPGAGQSASRVCFPNPWSQDTCYGLAGALDRRSRVEPPLRAHKKGRQQSRPVYGHLGLI